MRILNLTQHFATKEQEQAGVFEPDNEIKREIQALLTFNEIPLKEDMQFIAKTLTNIAKSYNPSFVMIGGAPFFMSTLELELFKQGLVPVYAFSKRESVEEKQEDGSVVKTNKFRHVGFVGVDEKR